MAEENRDKICFHEELSFCTQFTKLGINLYNIMTNGIE